jgi:endonuclease/exonuclease/phosphatase family metal-dependent hydrolase
MHRIAWTALVATAVALLMQEVRLVFPLLYGVREDTGAGLAVAWALVAFVIGPALLAHLPRAFDGAGAIRVAVVSLAAARIAAQFVHPIPVWVGVAGVTIGLAALLLLLTSGRARGAGAATGVAMVAGLALDSTMFGTFGTWDAVWQDTTAAYAVGVTLGSIAVMSAVAVAPGPSDTEGLDAWPMVLVGPFLLLQVLFLQNVAFGTSETGMGVAGGVALVLLGDLLGVLLASVMAGRPHSSLHVATGIVMVIAVGAIALVDGTIVALAMPVAAGAAAATVAIAMAAPVPEGPRGGSPRSTMWFVVGTAIFVAAAFAYQIDIDAPLPVPRAVWPLTAAAVLSFGSFRRHRPERVSVTPALVPLIGAVIVPLLLIDLGGRMVPGSPPSSVRILDWNIHTAVDGNGQIVLGDVLALIESQQPDIVVLQEVGRGWPIAGQSDDLEWLAEELDMAYAWAPAADGQFGNAILSPYAIERDRVIGLPYGEGPQERSAIGATIATDPALLIVGTHLQHGDRPATRSQQLEAVIRTWGGTGRWVLAGDLNMQPGQEDLTVLEEAGLTSVQDLIGDPSASTARDPVRPGDRVDWIWASDELEVSNFTIARSEASDHLPLVVDVVP